MSLELDQFGTLLHIPDPDFVVLMNRGQSACVGIEYHSRDRTWRGDAMGLAGRFQFPEIKDICLEATDNGHAFTVLAQSAKDILGHGWKGKAGQPFTCRQIPAHDAAIVSRGDDLLVIGCHPELSQV